MLSFFNYNWARHMMTTSLRECRAGRLSFPLCIEYEPHNSRNIYCASYGYTTGCRNEFRYKSKGHMHSLSISILKAVKDDLGLKEIKAKGDKGDIGPQGPSGGRGGQG